MNITIIHVGQMKESYFTEAVAEYEKRLSKFCTVKNIYIKEARIDDNNVSETEISSALELEAENILEALPPAAKCVNIALCIEGKLFSTEKLYDMINSARLDSKDLCFVIGGSRGLSEQVKSKCTYRMSMSPMTFPHHLARVMLLEQIYRCASIIQGSKYHK
ncbi:MAG: hypothetical protein A2Y17_06125 [Clostridiales bacterium GWF2_38_85]|nr:MAG: hypothetical protein A2Y17_06125 [Clostridiales bacterium GWF2_38_85]